MNRDVRPGNIPAGGRHPGRAGILDLYRTQIRGLADLQAKDGRWTQLLDRPDSYLETSATAAEAFAAVASPAAYRKLLEGVARVVVALARPARRRVDVAAAASHLLGEEGRHRERRIGAVGLLQETPIEVAGFW